MSAGQRLWVALVLFTLVIVWLHSEGGGLPHWLWVLAGFVMAPVGIVLASVVFVFAVTGGQAPRRRHR